MVTNKNKEKSYCCCCWQKEKRKKKLHLHVVDPPTTGGFYFIFLLFFWPPRIKLHGAAKWDGASWLWRPEGTIRQWGQRRFREGDFFFWAGDEESCGWEREESIDSRSEWGAWGDFTRGESFYRENEEQRRACWKPCHFCSRGITQATTSISSLQSLSFSNRRGRLTSQCMPLCLRVSCAAKPETVEKVCHCQETACITRGLCNY